MALLIKCDKCKKVLEIKTDKKVVPSGQWFTITPKTTDIGYSPPGDEYLWHLCPTCLELVEKFIKGECRNY